MDRADGTPEARFLESARQCRTRDLQRLVLLAELVQDVGALVHGLQKERGASAIFLGSQGQHFAESVATHVAAAIDLERSVRLRLEHIDQQLEPMQCGARFYTRAACAFRAFDLLRVAREQIAALALAPQDAVKSFTDVIGCLLAVIFEVADGAMDAQISRSLLALVNFSQGKEYAGQERATAGAAFSRGRVHDQELRRLQLLRDAQEQAFGIFSDFAPSQRVDEYQRLAASTAAEQVRRIRDAALNAEGGSLAGVTADAWFSATTRRIDAMKSIEEQLSDDLKRLCNTKLREAGTEPIESSAPIAMLVADVDGGRIEAGLDTSIGLYAMSPVTPRPMRSLLAVLQAQSRRIEEVSHQLESARTALHERKVIERAKGVLMKSRQLSETDAYAQIRQAAMNQNKRMIEVAEAIVSMAEILRA